MAQGIDSTKTAARPSHEAIESEHREADGENKESKADKLDSIGMESAKRAQNRLHSNEEVDRKESIFTK